MAKTKSWRELRGRSKVAPDKRARTDAALKDEVKHRPRHKDCSGGVLGTSRSSEIVEQSTLGRFVHALGGKLKIVVQF